MSTYMEFVKVKHGYRSLKSNYYDQFPLLGCAGNFGMSDMTEKPTSNGEDADIVPLNPIEEKDQMIDELKKALEDSGNEVNDVTAIKECLEKTRQEFNIARRLSNLSNNKIDFASKVTEQRMSNSLSNLSTDLEEELVSLYSTPIDEEAFKMEDDEILNQENLL